MAIVATVVLLGIGLLVSKCVVASDVAFIDIAASVSATNAINAPKALNSVASAADKAAELDESCLVSVVLVELCVFERFDVVCQHGESWPPERPVLHWSAHDEIEVDPTVTKLLDRSQKERVALNRAGMRIMSGRAS